MPIKAPDVAIDLGTTNTMLYVYRKGIVVNEPTLVVTEARDRRLVRAVGDEARYLYAVVTASAAYGLIRVWLRGDISKSPAELVKLLVDVFGNKLT